MKLFLVKDYTTNLQDGHLENHPERSHQEYFVRYKQVEGDLVPCDQSLMTSTEITILKQMSLEQFSKTVAENPSAAEFFKEISPDKIVMTVGVSNSGQGYGDELGGFINLYSRYPGNILHRLWQLSGARMKAQVQLNFLQNGWNLDVTCKISTADRDIIHDGLDTHWANPGVKFPKTHFADWNTCKFETRCKMSILVTIPDDMIKKYVESKRSMTQQSKDFIPVPKPMNSVTQKMLESGVFSDVTIVAGDGTEIKAHRSFLGAQSSVFSTMFESDMREVRESQVEIADMDGKSVRALLMYLYCNDATEAYKNCGLAFALFNAGHKYDIGALETEMKDVLLNKPSEWYNGDVGVKLFLFARNITPANEKLKMKAIEVLKRYGKTLEESPTYQELFEKDKKAAMELCRYAFTT